MKHVEVVCAVIKKDNKYFCCQRGVTKSLADKWEFPGGKIETNETNEEALVREIEEELKSKIKVIRYITTVNHDYNDLEKPFSITMHAYLCELIHGNLELTEHVDSKFLTANEMEELDFAAADKPILNYLK